MTYYGTPWNHMPTKGRGERQCPNCNYFGEVELMEYEDAEYFTCPKCKTHVTLTPKNGRFGQGTVLTGFQPDGRGKRKDDFKRNADRQYLTSKRRKKLGLDGE